MRACMVAYTFYEQDNRVMRYSEALVARGDIVDVIALRQPGQDLFCQYRGVSLYRIQTRFQNERSGKLNYLFRLSRFLFRSFWLLTKLHLRHPYAIVHIHSVPDFEVFAGLVPKLLGAKIILDIHDIVPEFYCSKFGASKHSTIYRFLVAIERISIKFSHHVIIANHIWYRRLLGRSVTETKCSVFLNYPDPGIFHERARKRTDNSFVYLYPGTINYHQGIDIAVRAFSRIKDELMDIQLWIYGDGPDRRRIEILIKELGLNDRVLIFDPIPMEEIASVMAEADVAVVPKRSDSFGDEAFSTKSLEFMATGVPLIMSNTTIDRFYFNDSLVRFFRSDDEEALALQMRQLREQPAVRMSLKKAAAVFVEDLRWDKHKVDYLGLIDSLTRLRSKSFIQIPKRGQRRRRNTASFLVSTYYRIRPIIPRRLQLAFRRQWARIIRSRYREIWPINLRASTRPLRFQGWPDDKRFALVLRHDVETNWGAAKCAKLMEIDANYGLRAGYFLVPEGYNVSDEFRAKILSSGCEVGVHGLKHDGRLYESRAIFNYKAQRINQYLADWGVVGFASPSTHHNLEWLHDLNIFYDASTFDTDPFEPQPENLDTVFPIIVSRGERSFVELPYTMPQDHLLYIIMRERTIQIWKDKLDWLVSHNGMVMFATHPDYMRFNASDSRNSTYPVSLYKEFLGYITDRYNGQYWAALPREVAAFWRGLVEPTTSAAKDVTDSVIAR